MKCRMNFSLREKFYLENAIDLWEERKRTNDVSLISSCNIRKEAIEAYMEAYNAYNQWTIM